MFWKKKQVLAVSAVARTSFKPSAGLILPATRETVHPQPKVVKLPGPKDIPELAGRYLVVEKKRDPDWVWHLKAVIRKNDRGKKVFDVRIFNEAQVAEKRVKVKDWTTFDEHPDLILYEGWFDKDSMRAELHEKKAR